MNSQGTRRTEGEKWLTRRLIPMMISTTFSYSGHKDSLIDFTKCCTSSRILASARGEEVFSFPFSIGNEFCYNIDKSANTTNSIRLYPLPYSCRQYQEMQGSHGLTQAVRARQKFVSLRKIKTTTRERRNRHFLQAFFLVHHARIKL